MDNCARRFLESTQFVVKVGDAAGLPGSFRRSRGGGSHVDRRVGLWILWMMMRASFQSPASM